MIDEVAQGRVGARPWLVPGILTALHFGLLLILISHHEMWRDEIQAWLLARDTLTPFHIFHNIRYEGHPALWHLLLWLPSHLSSNPHWMQGVHALIASGGAYLWWRYAPFPWWLRLWLPFTYYFFYEWGVISRNYAISVLLVFAVCALANRGWKRLRSIGALLFLLCHTNVHSTILVLGVAPFVALLYWRRRHVQGPGAVPRTSVLVTFVALVLAGVATSALQMNPPADSSFAAEWNFEWNDFRAARVAHGVVEAFAPVPPDRVDFWGTNIFFQNKDGVFSMDQRLPVGLWILVLSATCFLLRPAWLLPYLSCATGLLVFLYVKHTGYSRHYGFFLLAWLALLWMWRGQSGAAASALGRRVAHLQRVWIYALFAGVNVLGIWGAFVAARLDWRYPFSNSGQAAEYVREHYGTDVIITGDSEVGRQAALIGQVPVDRTYYFAERDWGSYVLWRKSPHAVRSPQDQIETLVSLHAGDPEKPLLYVTGNTRTLRNAPFAMEHAASFTGDNTTKESYEIYEIRFE